MPVKGFHEFWIAYKKCGNTEGKLHVRSTEDGRRPSFDSIFKWSAKLPASLHIIFHAVI